MSPPLRAHRQTPLFSSTYACLSDGRRLDISTPISLQDFLAHPHLLVSHDGRRGIVDDLLDARGISRTEPAHAWLRQWITASARRRLHPDAGKGHD